MSGRSMLGLVLVLIGIISLAYQGITYTTQKKVVIWGPFKRRKQSITRFHSLRFLERLPLWVELSF